ncbi:MAG: hypothetical protein HY560_08735 [Gemmatimonadetes bacterium]|nr:hypothetical protein [Gemmatimonadota bacterium]
MTDVQRAWTTGTLLAVATGLALWALLQPTGRRPVPLERLDEDEVERLRNLGAA